MSYLDPLPNQTDITKARQPLYPETQPLAVFNRLFGGALPPGTTPADTARLLAQKLSVLDFMRADLARLRDADPGKRKGPTRPPRRRHPEAGGDNPREPADRSGGACTVPAAPPMFTPAVPPRGPNPPSHDAGGARLLHAERARQPPAPGSRPPAPRADQGGVRLRPDARRDVQLGVRDQLGSVSGTLRRRDCRCRHNLVGGDRTTTWPIHRTPRHTRLAREGRRLLRPRNRAGAAGPRRPARQRRQQPARQHRRGVRQRGLADA